jgi:hypothetical protein
MRLLSGPAINQAKRFLLVLGKQSKWTLLDELNLLGG